VRDGGHADALVYRVVREALRNVRDHSGARRVSVVVTPTKVTVEDDGRGFDAGERARRREQGHVGLSLLADLAEQSGGRLTIDSAPDEGTRVILEMEHP
jgi:signal transduction histidine kinase